MISSNIFVDNVKLDIFQYSDGSVEVKLPLDIKHKECVDIKAVITDVSGILLLTYVLEQLQCMGIKCKLDLPYLPNSRQERSQKTDTCYKPNSFLSFARILSNYKTIIECITIIDPHSEDNISLLELLGLHVNVISIKDIFPLDNFQDIDYIISPDEGARKRTSLIATLLNVPMIVASKERNPDNWEIELILNTEFDLKDKNVLVVDDIIDYGNSLHDLTKVLKETYKVKHISCFISHGILPSNLRLTIPSRTSFALKYVDYFECYNLFNLPGFIDDPFNYTNLL